MKGEGGTEREVKGEGGTERKVKGEGGTEREVKGEGGMEREGVTCNLYVTVPFRNYSDTIFECIAAHSKCCITELPLGMKIYARFMNLLDIHTSMKHI